MTKKFELTRRPGSVFIDAPQPGIEHPSPIEPPDAAHNRRGAYAAMKDLVERFSEAGISTEQVWAFIKTEHAVESISQFSACQWALVSAQLQSIRRDAAAFKIFLETIPNAYFRIHAYASDPSVAIGRPRNIKKHHIAEEWGDFQEIANTNLCEIKVVQGKQTTYYSPSDPISPCGGDVDGQANGPPPNITPPPISLELETQPAVLEFKPDVALDTNARGEVLSPWGDVVDIREVGLPC